MLDDYLEAKKLGDRAYRNALLFRQSPYLESLDEFLKNEDIQGENRLGTLEIPVKDIAGTKTKARQQSFAKNFMPILGANTEFASKWASLYDSVQEEGVREPILVYEYMYKFYVQEGNKRVSVSRFNGAVSISATVIRILPKRTEEKENKLYYEFVEFYKCSGLYSIRFSEMGAYDRFSQFLGMKSGEIWPSELCTDVRSAYSRFSELYFTMGGKKLGNTGGDAFFLYINFYGLESILENSTEEIKEKLEKLWNEYKKSAGEVVLVQNPEEMKKTSGFFDFFSGGSSYTEKSALKIAFLYEKTIKNSTWAYSHELGRNDIQEKFHHRVETRCWQGCCTDEKLQEGIKEAVLWGAKVIFTTAPFMAQESVKAALEYPELYILNCSVKTSYNSIRTYYGRMYEAKFLMGALAASITDGNDLGYVEQFPLYGTVSNINAFAIGAQFINPWAKVHLSWSGLINANWKEEFRRKDIHTISGPEFSKPFERSREFGLYISSNGEVGFNVAAAVYNWGKYYEIIIRSILEGNYDANSLAKTHSALNYYYGLKEGVIDVILSGNLSYSSKKLMSILEKEIEEGRLLPFSGEIHSQTEKIRAEGAESLNMEEIVDMRWLNDNVIGEIPPLEAFTKEAQETILSGGFLL
jgi:hypothetical protein